MMVAIFGIMLLVLALVDSSVAATALMYDDINCPSNELNSKCVNLEENSCCISGFGVRLFPRTSTYVTSLQHTNSNISGA
jgi:hypothetical protein